MPWTVQALSAAHVCLNNYKQGLYIQATPLGSSCLPINFSASSKYCGGPAVYGGLSYFETFKSMGMVPRSIPGTPIAHVAPVVSDPPILSAPVGLESFEGGTLTYRQFLDGALLLTDM